MIPFLGANSDPWLHYLAPHQHEQGGHGLGQTRFSSGQLSVPHHARESSSPDHMNPITPTLWVFSSLHSSSQTEETNVGRPCLEENTETVCKPLPLHQCAWRYQASRHNANAKRGQQGATEMHVPGVKRPVFSLQFCFPQRSYYRSLISHSGFRYRNKTVIISPSKGKGSS